MFGTKIHFYIYILLSVTMLYCNENPIFNTINQEITNIPSDIAKITMDLKDLQKADQNIYNTMIYIDDVLPCKSTISQIIQGLYEKDSFFEQKTNDYIEQFIQDDCLWNKCDKLSQPFKNFIQSKTIQNSCNPIILPYQRSLQKTSVKFISPTIVSILHFQTEYDWATSWDERRAYTAKQLNFFDIINNKLHERKQIIYHHDDILDDEPYINQPIYKNEKEENRKQCNCGQYRNPPLRAD